MSEARILAVAGLGGAAPSLSTSVFDTNNDLLLIFALVTSLSISGVPEMQFNGDTGTDYSFSVSDNFATPVTGASAAGIQFGAINSTGAFGCQMTIGNAASGAHAAFFSGLAASSLGPTVAPHIINGAGVWIAGAQINQVGLSSPQGGNLGIGSGIMVVAYLP